MKLETTKVAEILKGIKNFLTKYDDVTFVTKNKKLFIQTDLGKIDFKNGYSTTVDIDTDEEVSFRLVKDDIVAIEKTFAKSKDEFLFFEQQDFKLVVHDSKKELEFNGLDVGFDSCIPEEAKRIFSIKKEFFLDMMLKTNEIIDKDIKRVGYENMFMKVDGDQLTVCATNSFIITELKYQLNEPGIDGVYACFGKNYAQIKNINWGEEIFFEMYDTDRMLMTDNNCGVWLKREDQHCDKFNNIERLFPKESGLKTTVNSADLLNTLKELAPFSNGVVFENGLIKSIETMATNKKKSALKIKTMIELPEDYRCGFTNKYLQAVLKNNKNSVTLMFPEQNAYIAQFKFSENERYATAILRLQ